MKKFLTIGLSILIILSIMPGCGNSTDNTSENKKLSVVTTIFPIYDWAKEIAANTDNTEFTMLLDNGVDLHSYQPTADDILKISKCDMFIYVGGESDEWVNDALKESVNKDMVVINLLDVLGSKVKEEEVVEGMQDDEDEDDGEDEEETEYDEHVWLSLKNAKTLCQYISDKFCEIDKNNKETYTANTKAYLEKLNTLDSEYKKAVDEAAVKTVVFGDRFPFRYLVDDYGLSYYAAFVGCSAETEASFKTIVFLANKVDELGLKSILQIESADGSIAKTIKNNTKSKNQKILTLDSIQSTTSKDIENGTTYISIMKNNLKVLKEALK